MQKKSPSAQDEGVFFDSYSIVVVAKIAGVSEQDMHREWGATRSTIHRWLTDDIAPRGGTRRLMQQSLMNFIENKIVREIKVQMENFG